MMHAAAPLAAYPQAFRSRTYAAGLGSLIGTNGVAVADYDRDGDLDVYLVARDAYDPQDARTWSRLFANLGDGTFSIVTTSAELAGFGSSSVASPYGYKMGAAWGDYDNDGWPDLYLSHLGPNQLLHNNGNGTFTDVTAQAGVVGGSQVLSSSAVWFDFDLDGDLDLYVSNWEFYASKLGNDGDDDRDRGNRLYRNRGNGRFDDVSIPAGVADAGATWMTVAFDVNADRFPDLYLANDFGPNTLYVNTGHGTFEEATAEFGVEDRYHGMGMAVADIDRNGLFDVYLTNISLPSFDQETNPLFLNTGDGGFVNASIQAGVSQAGWGWGTAFFDPENDGDEDLFVVTGNFGSDNPNVLFMNTSEAGRLRFEESAEAFGVADMMPGRGVAVFDYDADGDQDLLISNVFEPASLYRNDAATGSWLQVQLEGTVSNRDAIGAVVEVQADGATYRHYHHGAQFLAQSLMPIHFGLGPAGEEAVVTVSWPSGRIETITAVGLNQLIAVREGAGMISGETATLTETGERPEAGASPGNYPDPFIASTTVPFVLRTPGVVTLIVRNALGQTVDVLDAHFGGPGHHALEWHPSPAHGSGVYFYEIRADQGAVFPRTGAMIYVRP